MSRNRKNQNQAAKGKEFSFTITEQGKKIRKKPFLEEQFLNKKYPIIVSSLQDEEKLAYENLKKRKQIIKTELQKNRSATLTKLGKDILKQGLGSEDVIDTITGKLKIL